MTPRDGGGAIVRVNRLVAAVARVRDWILDPLDRADVLDLARITGMLNAHVRTVAPPSD